MRNKLIVCCAAAFLIAVFCAVSGIAKTEVPGRTKTLVNDYAGILDADTKQYLENVLQDLKRSKETEFVISTFDSLGGMSVDSFVSAYTKNWRRGFLSESDKRVHMIVLMGEKKIRIGVGLPFEKIVTNKMVNEIITYQILPLFKEGRYEEGVSKGADAILTVLNNSRLPSFGYLLNKKIWTLAAAIAVLVFVLFAVKRSRR